MDDVAAARAARDAAEQHLRDTIRRALTQPRAHRPRAGDIAAAAGLSRGRCYQIRDEP
ncbi:hypothetical protein [Actinomadura flavalba]|uniref:hypothetical protein n=1 Tax=Actinomadura flavalba TaxID=1120938 RepID=UPI0012DE89E0|nr:hypothetical protein [Actinomadura flavalba]